MKHTILSAFEELPYFTVNSFRQIAGDEITPAHARIALHRWAQAGHILQLKKGVYMHRRFFEQHRAKLHFSAVVSAILFPQSYLSLEYILQQHGVLTEITYPVTAITTKNTRTIQNKIGIFVYRHIKPKLYHGFDFKRAYGISYAQASAAKALFDYLYLRPFPSNRLPTNYNLADELRLNLEDFSTTGRQEFCEYVRISDKPKMYRIHENLERTIWSPRHS
jgi:predicted transcriptional regulator of viral defense system